MTNEYRSPQTLSNLTSIGLGILIGTNFLSFVLGFMLLITPDVDLVLDGEDVPGWVMAAGLIALPHLLGFIFTVIIFLIWIHRAAANLRPLKATINDYTPGWAVGWWFIPFANLLKPFHVMRELWCESDPEVDPDTGFTFSGAHAAPTFMVVWWILWVTSNILSNITSRLDLTKELLIIDMVTNGGFIFAGILAIVAVRGITARQDERISKIRTAYIADVPPPPVFEGNQI